MGVMSQLQPNEQIHRMRQRLGLRVRQLREWQRFSSAELAMSRPADVAGYPEHFERGAEACSATSVSS